MTFHDTLKCPGLNKTLSIVPVEIDCPRCKGVVELWSDESKRRCTQCGTMIYNPKPLVPMVDNTALEVEKNHLKDSMDALVELALNLGSSAVTILDSRDIQIDNQMADLCRETNCPNYGASPTCPPHVKGPDWLRTYKDTTCQVILIEIEVSQELMYSDKGKELSKLLHYIVIQVEQAAHENGLMQSIAFAGGSCKSIQCPEHAYCNVLAGNGSCRHPNLSRPSVSGHGINMNHLLKSAGWIKKSSDSPVPLSSRYGLVLVG